MTRIVVFHAVVIQLFAHLCFLFPPQDSFAQSKSSSDNVSYARGTELARAGKLEQALEALKKAAEESPRNPKIHNILGVVLTQLNRLEEADVAYGHALTLDPDFFPARKNRAVNSFNQGKLQFAAQEFEALAKLDPKDFVPPLFLGLLAIQGSELEAARKHLLQAHHLSSNDGRVLLALTKVYFLLGERPEALRWAHQMRTKSQGIDAERFELGVLLAQFEANVEAVEIFQQLWEKKPSGFDVGFNLALVQYRVGQLEAALRTVEELGSQAKATGELLNLRGWIYNKMHRFDQARESFQLAIAAEPGNPDHYLDLSSVLSNQGETQAAIEILTEACSRNGEKDRFQVQIGLFHQKSGEYKEAEKWYRTALQTHPSSRSAYLALASLMLVTDRTSEGLDLLAQAIKVLPSDFLLYHMYGGLLLESQQEPAQGQLETAAAVLQKALKLNPVYANTYYVLGKLYLKRAEYDSAKWYFRQACGFNPNHVGAYYQLSLIARRQGDSEESAKLAGVVQTLNTIADQSYQADFLGVVEDALGRSSGKAWISKLRN